MGFGIFKKIRDGIKKAAQWVNNKVIKPAVNIVKKVVTPENIKKAIDFGTKVAPLIGAGAAAAGGGNPMQGFAAGTTVQNIGKTLGYG